MTTDDLRSLGQSIVDKCVDLDAAEAALAKSEADLAASEQSRLEDQQEAAAEIADLKSKCAGLQSQLDALTKPAVPYPVVASPQANTGETWAQAAVRTLGYGFNGLVRYYPIGATPSWDTQLRALAAAHPGQLVLQVTAKTHSDAGLDAILKNAPATWTVLYNYFQEPEDNDLTTDSQKAYRDTVSQAAAVCRANNAGLPWVEWQEWTIDPANTRGWDLANFTPPAGDFAGVLWSLFEYGEKAPPKDRLDAQVARIVAAMGKYAPGKPWALMASGYTLEPAAGPFTAAQTAAQAAWLAKAYAVTKAAGCQGFAWFNCQMAGTGGASGESRVELNPAALSALKAL